MEEDKGPAGALGPPCSPAEPLVGNARYEKVADLNQGTFGFVQLAKDAVTGEFVAIKFIERGSKVTKYVEREIINHRQLCHPHIVEQKEVFLTSGYLAVAMEYAAGGDLFHRVARNRGMGEEEARWFFQQLVVAMDYCHRMGVANRDIKLENTLLDTSLKPIIKLCDFGYSKHERFQSAPGSRVGTPAYLAPEVVLATAGSTYDGKAADVWSAGVMLFIMVAACYPFGRPEDRALPPAARLNATLQRILRVECCAPAAVAGASPEMRDLLGRLLVADPARRISMEALMQHPWFTARLPMGVLNMNERLVRESSLPMPGKQSVEEVLRLVSLAQAGPDKPEPQLNLAEDTLLDSLLEQEGLQGAADSDCDSA